MNTQTAPAPTKEKEACSTDKSAAAKKDSCSTDKSASQKHEVKTPKSGGCGC